MPWRSRRYRTWRCCLSTKARKEPRKAKSPCLPSYCAYVTARTKSRPMGVTVIHGYGYVRTYLLYRTLHGTVYSPYTMTKTFFMQCHNTNKYEYIPKSHANSKNQTTKVVPTYHSSITTMWQESLFLRTRVVADRCNSEATAIVAFCHQRSAKWFQRLPSMAFLPLRPLFSVQDLLRQSTGNHFVS